MVRYGGTCLDCVVLCIRTRIVSGTLRHRNSDYFCSRSFELVECWGCHFHNHYTTSERIRMRMSPPHKDLLCRMPWKGGHALGVSRSVFTPAGNMIVSGGKDCTIKFWDCLSGICVNSIQSHLGEVTSIEMSSNGLLLLSGSKDNGNRLWDVRMVYKLMIL